MKFSTWNVFSGKKACERQAGFTLIEMLVVAAITGFITTSLVVNFSKARLDIKRGGNFVISVVRDAQTKATSSAKYNNYNPCGYGIHYIDASSFAIYAGPNASTTTCANINRNYQLGEDSLLAVQVFGESGVRFMSSFPDIFFEPPDPKTYLNDNGSLNQPPVAITIGETNGTCPQNCKTINVYPSGKIELQ